MRATLYLGYDMVDNIFPYQFSGRTRRTAQATERSFYINFTGLELRNDTGADYAWSKSGSFGEYSINVLVDAAGNPIST